MNAYKFDIETVSVRYGYEYDESAHRFGKNGDHMRRLDKHMAVHALVFSMVDSDIYAS